MWSLHSMCIKWFTFAFWKSLACYIWANKKKMLKPPICKCSKNLQQQPENKFYESMQPYKTRENRLYMVIHECILNIF